MARLKRSLNNARFVGTVAMYMVATFARGVSAKARRFIPIALEPTGRIRELVLLACALVNPRPIDAKAQQNQPAAQQVRR
jgi:hypothetical protein